MARTVKVGLDVDEKPYVRGVERAEKATDKLDDALDDVKGSARDTAAGMGKAKESIDDTGNSARSAGRALDGLTRDAAKLDRQIDDTTRGVRELARAIAATSDEAERAKLAEKLTVERGKLRQQVDLRKLIDFDDGAARKHGMRFGGRVAEGIVSGLSTAGGPISRALGNVFGTLPPQAQAAIGAGLVGAVATAAPLMAGVISGAVVGGVGIGGVLGGLAIAAGHADVQKAAKATGDTFMQVMQRSAVAFVPVTVDALGHIRAEVRDMGDDFERIFAGSARFVAPLTQGVTGFVRELLPGIEAAVDRGGPIIDEIASWGPKLGGLVSDVFTKFAGQAEEGASALAAFWTVMEAGIRLTANTIVGLTAVYGGMQVLSALLRGDIGKLLELATAEQRAKGAGDELAGGLQGIIDGFKGTGSAVASVNGEFRTLSDLVDEIVNKNLSLAEAQLRLKEAVNQAAEAVDGKRAVSDAEQGSLIGLARALNDTTTAMDETGVSADEAAAAHGRNRKQLYDAAIAAGYTEQKAWELADQWLKVPKNVKTTAKADTAAALSAMQQLKQYKIPDKTFYINGMYRELRISGEGSAGGFANRWGGVYEHAQDGLINLRQAGVYSPMGPARYAFAEPATGGEAFVPKNGDPERSLRILEKAADWYGASVVPQQTMPQRPMYVSGGGGGGTQTHRVVLQWPDGQMAGEIVYNGFTGSTKAYTGFRKAVTASGGNPRVLDR